MSVNGGDKFAGGAKSISHGGYSNVTQKWFDAATMSNEEFQQIYGETIEEYHAFRTERPEPPKRKRGY